MREVEKEEEEEEKAWRREASVCPLYWDEISSSGQHSHLGETKSKPFWTHWS